MRSCLGGRDCGGGLTGLAGIVGHPAVPWGKLFRQRLLTLLGGLGKIEKMRIGENQDV